MPFDGKTFEQSDDVLDVLRRGRERVAKPGGWCQGSFYDPAGRVCAIAALADDITQIETGVFPSPLQREAMVALHRVVPSGETTENYNDAPLRTQAEIVALFDCAIAQREKKGATRT